MVHSSDTTCTASAQRRASNASSLAAGRDIHAPDAGLVPLHDDEGGLCSRGGPRTQAGGQARAGRFAQRPCSHHLLPGHRVPDCHALVLACSHARRVHEQNACWEQHVRRQRPLCPKQQQLCCSSAPDISWLWQGLLQACELALCGPPAVMRRKGAASGAPVGTGLRMADSTCPSWALKPVLGKTSLHVAAHVMLLSS